MSSVTAPQYNQRDSPDSWYRKRCRSATRRACVQRVSPGAHNEVPQSRGLPQREGSNGRPSRSRDTRYGTRGPGRRADPNAKTSRQGLLAGDDGASLLADITASPLPFDWAHGNLPQVARPTAPLPTGRSGGDAVPEHAYLGGSFGFEKQDALQKLPECDAILVWPPMALVVTLVSERQFDRTSCSPPRPPVDGSCRTVLLIAVPPSCRLSVRPFRFQAP